MNATDKGLLPIGTEVRMLYPPMAGYRAFIHAHHPGSDFPYDINVVDSGYGLIPSNEHGFVSITEEEQWPSQ